MGRPTKYSEPLAEKLCERIAGGESLIQICKDSKMPSRSTVFNWLLKDEYKSFLDKYLAARSIAGHACADQILGLVDDLRTGVLEPQIAREISSNLRWSAERMAPRYYSSRHTVTAVETSVMSHEEWLKSLS